VDGYVFGQAYSFKYIGCQWTINVETHADVLRNRIAETQSQPEHVYTYYNAYIVVTITHIQYKYEG